MKHFAIIAAAIALGACAEPKATDEPQGIDLTEPQLVALEHYEQDICERYDVLCVTDKYGTLHARTLTVDDCYDIPATRMSDDQNAYCWELLHE